MKKKKSANIFGKNDLPAIASLLMRRFEDWAEWRHREFEPEWERDYRQLEGTLEGYGWSDFGGQRNENSQKSTHYYHMTRAKVKTAVSVMAKTLINSSELPFDINSTPRSDSPDLQAWESLGVDPKKRILGMKSLIKDQLIEAGYQNEIYKCLLSLARYGSACIKGPIMTTKKRRVWAPEIDKETSEAIQQQHQEMISQLQEQAQQALANAPPEQQEEIQKQLAQQMEQLEKEAMMNMAQAAVYEPRELMQNSVELRCVDIWDIYPDPEAENVQLGQGIFERIVVRSEEIASWADATDEEGKPLYDRDAIVRVLEGATTSRDSERYVDGSSTNSYLEHRGPHRESIKNTNEDGRLGKWHAVLFYSGAITRAGVSGFIDDQDKYESDYIRKHEPIEIEAVIVDGEVLLAKQSEWRDKMRPYHIAPFEQIEGSPFGKSIPWMMRDPQGAINTFVKLMLDNKRFAGAPREVIYKDAFENPDDPVVPGGRLILDKPVSGGIASVYQQVVFPDISRNMLEIIQFSERWGNMASSIPAFLDGDSQLSNQTTATEASLLNSSAMAQLGMPIRWVDERIIKPMVVLFYDWNMRHGEDEAIKGDFEIEAKGFKSYTDRELRMQRIMQLLSYLGTPLAQAVETMVSQEKAIEEVVSILELDDLLMNEVERRAYAERKTQAMEAQEQSMNKQYREQIEGAKELAKIKAETTAQAKQMLEQMRIEFEAQQRDADRTLDEKIKLIQEETKRLLSGKRN
jgi:hypothetical protein